jgi:hypothetical protein
MSSFEADQLLVPEDSSWPLDTAAGPWGPLRQLLVPGQLLVSRASCHSSGTAYDPWGQLLVPVDNYWYRETATGFLRRSAVPGSLGTAADHWGQLWIPVNSCLFLADNYWSLESATDS